MTDHNTIQITKHEHYPHIIMWKVNSSWQWSDFDRAFSTTMNMLQNDLSRTINSILIDMQESGNTPSGGIVHIHQALMRCTFDNLTVVICSPDLFLRLLISSYHRVLQSIHVEIKVAQTLKQGLELVT